MVFRNFSALRGRSRAPAGQAHDRPCSTNIRACAHAFSRPWHRLPAWAQENERPTGLFDVFFGGSERLAANARPRNRPWSAPRRPTHQIFCCGSNAWRLRSVNSPGSSSNSNIEINNWRIRSVACKRRANPARARKGRWARCACRTRPRHRQRHRSRLCHAAATHSIPASIPMRPAPPIRSARFPPILRQSRTTWPTRRTQCRDVPQQSSQSAR